MCRSYASRISMEDCFTEAETGASGAFLSDHCLAVPSRMWTLLSSLF